MTANPKDFSIGKEVFWVSYHNGRIIIKSGLITQLSANHVNVKWNNRKKWNIFAEVDYESIPIGNLYNSKKEVKDALLKYAGEL
jgi:hypothetical protein